MENEITKIIITAMSYIKLVMLLAMLIIGVSMAIHGIVVLTHMYIE